MRNGWTAGAGQSQSTGGPRGSGTPQPQGRRETRLVGWDDAWSTGARHLAHSTSLLGEATAQAWRAFDRAAGRGCGVAPALPILFFGDLDAYRSSRLRVLTVGLNPSLNEFPRDEPFRRFPPVGGGCVREPSRYLAAMSGYFRTDPYRGWFRAYESLLGGLGASYYEGGSSTALHTDICSPVATDPTWSLLDEADRSALAADGVPLWHALVRALRPQIVVLSVARAHLERIGFAASTDWHVAHVFDRTGTGKPRSAPYEVVRRWFEIDGRHSMFAFGRAAQTPFGLLADAQKREAGAVLLEEYDSGR